MRIYPDKKFLVKIKTGKQAVALSVTVGTSAKNSLIISAFDDKDTKTFFFSREAFPKHDKTYHFGIPKTDDYIYLLIYSLSDNYSFDVKSVVVNPINKLKAVDFVIDENTKIFQDFIKDFSFNFNKYKVDEIVDDRHKKFKINIVEQIADTPARIGEFTNIMQVSKADFDNKTVSQRSLILSHEYSHNFVNIDPDDEFEADINGLKIYLSMRYPVIEAYQTFLSLTPSVFSAERLKNAENFLNNYESELIFNYE